MSKNKTQEIVVNQYDVHLPVFKQGDDFGWQLEHEKTPAKAFTGLAAQYRSAAEDCEKIACAIGRVSDPSLVFADGDTHCIWVSLPEEQAKDLLEEGILSKDEYEDEEEWDEEDLEEGEGEVGE